MTVDWENEQDLDGPAFVQTMAAAYVERGCFESVNDQAIQYCLNVLVNFLADEKIEYGDPEYCWNASGARDMALEEMSYWED